MKADLALDRERLVHRSQLVRMQLRREMRGVRESLHWTRSAATFAAAPMTRRVALGIALSLLGAGRASGIIKVVGRAVLALQVGRTLWAAGAARVATRKRTTR
jgi:hypothetical protein